MHDVSRRDFLAASIALCAIESLPFPSVARASQARDEEDLLKYVDPRIGTGGFGHCYPGATVPFGAVQLSPDTNNSGWDWCSGYHAKDDSIMGFSHTHLSGTGCGDLLDFLVMAGTGQAKLVPGSRENPERGYRSRFDHRDEHAEPGYYSVLLKDYGIRAELTATERCGFHKYTFPRHSSAYLILDLHHAYENDGKSPVVSAQLSNVDGTGFSGGRITNAWGQGRHSYFAMQISKNPDRVLLYQDGKKVSLSSSTGVLEVQDLKAVLYFSTKDEETIYIKTAISGVSAAGAANNLQAEIPGWDFDETRKAAQDKWRAQISKIRIRASNVDHKRIFYTALYHLSLGPTRFDDVDGRYRGMDRQVRQLSDGARNYTTFSLWDTYRAAHPLYTLIEKDRVPQFVNSLVRMAEESPQGMPVWPLQGCETGCMTGYHSAGVISEAINKNFPGIDATKAYALMMKRAMQDDYRGLDYYRKLHYIPADKEEESVSKTFEYCYDDWAISHVAKKLGKSDEAAMLAERSTNYRRYFNQTTKFIQPRLENGSWALPFDPKAMGHSKRWRDFTESNSWQTTFAVQHDAAGLIELFGGREAFVAKLDQLFVQKSDLPSDAPPDITGLVGQYAHGNEPSHHIAYLYVYAGAPHKTQARVRSLLETMYAAKADGMQGNEDVGQMSAWFLISALGFYPVDPVSGIYIVGSPLVDQARVDLGRGKFLEIEVIRDHAGDAYVQGFSLNGVAQQRTWFRHSEIADGARLTFRMGASPHPTLGVRPEDAPPSLRFDADSFTAQSAEPGIAPLFRSTRGEG